MFSLKLKLVAYFLVLATLPLAAGYWGFASSLSNNERTRADERLAAELRAATAAYREELATARGDAAALAKSAALHEALGNHDEAALDRLALAHPNVQVRVGGKVHGRPVTGQPAARIVVRNRSGVLGQVVAVVSLDDSLARRLGSRAGLEKQDSLVVVAGSRIVGGPGDGDTLALGSDRNVDIDGIPFRAAAMHGTPRDGAATIAVVTPLEAIDAAASSARRQLLLGVLASLLLIALVAYVEGGVIVRTIGRFVGAAQAISRGRLEERVPVQTRDEFGALGRAFNEMADELESQRRRLHLATRRFGEALAATHDVDQLLRVIVATAVESTRATGGAIRSRNGDVAQAGVAGPGVEEIALPLAIGGDSFGTLVLWGGGFDDHDREIAASLAAHAVTGLENARLHKLVERQALLDSLTGMPNRRQCEAALATELAQAKRVGGTLAFVLADLDEFKTVNDRFGHLVGDHVLREFSDILRELVREADVAARWAGDEFALVLSNTDAEGAAVLLERIRSTLEHREIRVDGHTVTISASFGVAMFPEEQSSQRLIAAADGALYAAKRAGKNRIATSPGLSLSA